MKIRVRTVIEGPNKRGKYRALMIVDGKRQAASRWISERAAIARLREAHDTLMEMSKDSDFTVTFNPGHAPL